MVEQEQPSTLPLQWDLLQLLHPKGTARYSVRIGSNYSELFLPTSRNQPEQLADLLVVAPSEAECHSNDRFGAMVSHVATQLADDGLAYALVPRRWRLKFMRLLRKHGLVLEVAMVHIPYGAAGSWLVPLRRRPARYAFAKLIATSFVRRWLVLSGLQLPSGATLLACVLPTVGLVVRHPGARPIFDWLLRSSHQFQRAGNVIIQPSWRGPDGAIILHCFVGQEAQPSRIAKLVLTNMKLERIGEAALLARLGSRAQRAGVQVPRVVQLKQVGGYPVLVQSVVRGRSLAAMLAAQPHLLGDIVERIVHWLMNWNKLTQVTRVLNHEDLQRTLLVPAALLAPLLQGGEEYLDWLEQHCAIVAGTSIPFVAAHNDLTMRNVLLDEQGRLGVIDWETSCMQAFPLVDFFYAVTDAVAATQRYADRSQAFAACFAPNGAYASMVAQHKLRFRQSLGISAEVADLCFHACWLHHAVNEHRVNTPSDPRPFLQIVQWLALHRTGFAGETNA